MEQSFGNIVLIYIRASWINNSDSRKRIEENDKLSATLKQEIDQLILFL